MPSRSEPRSQHVIFLIMGLGNQGDDLHALKKALEGFGALEILLAPDVTERCADICDIEAIARAFAGRIVTTPQANHVTLIGYSTGGVLAFEAARVLETMNRSPELLLLIDSNSAASERPRFENLTKMMRMGKTPGLLLRYMASSALLGLNQPGLLRRLVLVAIKLAGKPWARPMRRELLLYLWRNEMKNYEPGPYGGRVALVLAEKQRSGVIAGDLGWGRLAPQVEIIPVQGNHFTLIEPPLLEANMSRISPLLGSSSAPAAEDKRAEAN